MRQVPENLKYLLVGDGRLAHHFSHYLNLLELPYLRWNRKGTSPLRALIPQSSHVLLAVSDSALCHFTDLAKENPDKKFIHFSGAFEVSGLHGAHPLMTFGRDLYDLLTYQKIPFMTARPLAELLPSLPNESFHLNPEQKALYHALCVVAGNFPMLLWKEVFATSEKQLQLPPKIFSSYLQQCLTNSLRGDEVSGPISRGDTNTLEKNLQALRGLPDSRLESVYELFKNLYHQEKTP